MNCYQQDKRVTKKTLNYKEKCYDFLNSNEVEGF